MRKRRWKKKKPTVIDAAENTSDVVEIKTGVGTRQEWIQ